MGRDKASLIVDNQPLVRRQLEILRQAGASELIISVGAGAGSPQPFESEGVRLVADAFEDSGPLGGLHAALTVCRCDWLMVLAVDMGRMTANCLSQLAAQAKAGCGVVPKLGHNYEPLAAIYPRSVADEARLRLERRQLDMQGFVEACVVAGRLLTWEAPEAGRELFGNWNSPSDLPPGINI